MEIEEEEEEWEPMKDGNMLLDKVIMDMSNK